jgi:predicted nucleic-acid-binding Zn-ribbon protein
MTDLKECPKCKGKMSAGTLKKIGYYGNPPYEFAPDGETPFPVKGVPGKRKQLSLYCCENCGFIEFYGK